LQIDELAENLVVVFLGSRFEEVHQLKLLDLQIHDIEEKERSKVLW